MHKISVYDGNYVVLLSEDCSTFEALRHGKKWRDLTGDVLIYQLCLEIIDLRSKILKQREAYQEQIISDKKAHKRLLDLKYPTRRDMRECMWLGKKIIEQIEAKAPPVDKIDNVPEQDEYIMTRESWLANRCQQLSTLQKQPAVCKQELSCRFQIFSDKRRCGAPTVIDCRHKQQTGKASPKLPRFSVVLKYLCDNGNKGDCKTTYDVIKKLGNFT